MASSRSGDPAATFVAMVLASWVGWLTLAVCTAISEALRPAAAPARQALRTSLVAANDDVEHAVVVRLRR